jgi:hypothetical protein
MMVLAALLSFVPLATLAILLILRVKTRHMLQFSTKIPGPKPLPIIGNIFDLGMKPEGGYTHWCGQQWLTVHSLVSTAMANCTLTGVDSNG